MLPSYKLKLTYVAVQLTIVKNRDSCTKAQAAVLRQLKWKLAKGIKGPLAREGKDDAWVQDTCGIERILDTSKALDDFGAPNRLQ